MSELRFSWPTRIYWEDTDAGGVVYHARYVAFMERARTEWMRAMGYGQEAMRSGDGQVFVVRAMTLDSSGRRGWTTRCWPRWNCCSAAVPAW